MLKITKGLKKKKKGKKSKHKEEELFDSAELEQYRREHQRSSEENADDSKESEEWQKFKALTSGVDDILKKTQGDLDRIKSTSFFQKKQPGTSEQPAEKAPESEKLPPPKEKKWVDFESEGVEEENDTKAGEGEEQKEPKQPEQTQREEERRQEQQVPESEEETEEDDEPEDDDLFDTSYVDVVASGQVKLAFIPESPTLEETSFDPFDTSIVDKVIKPEDQNEKKKPVVSLGCAVQVLTGQVDRASPAGDTKSSKRRRQLKRDLLLGSFDEDTKFEDESQIKSADSPPKSILDQDPVFDADNIVLAPVTPLLETGTVTFPEEDTTKLLTTDVLQSSRELIEEFEPSVSNPIAELEEVEKGHCSDEDLDDEFTALATESITKEVKHTEEKGKPQRPPVPQLPPSLIETSAALLSSELSDRPSEEEEGDDPFDTSFATKVLPGKFELKIIEREILNDDPLPEPRRTVDIDVREKINIVLNAAEEGPAENLFREELIEDSPQRLNFKHRDLLGGSTTDLSKIGHTPIKPAESLITEPKTEEPVPVDSDPFDTSAVEILAAPGKTELKYLEEELLQQQVEQVSLKVDVEVDNDFDPRAEEATAVTPKPNRPDKLQLEDKKFLIPKVVAFDIKSPSNLPDLLAVGKEEVSKISGKPLTPYYPDTKVLEEKSSFETQEADPFDTSFVTNCPGKIELKLLENELVGGELKHSLSDPDFNPRDEGAEVNPVFDTPFQINPPATSEGASYFRAETQGTELSDQFGNEFQTTVDPFDTSIVDNLLNTEQTLFAPKSSSGSNISDPASSNLFADDRKDSIPTGDDLYESDENITAKPLTPLVSRSSIVIPEEDIDPFDTSIVGEIVPGKTELKLLESELMSN